jgi:hypothetical protein
MRLDRGWVLVAIFLVLFALLVRSPYFTAFRGGTVIVVVIVGIREWRAQGRGWIPTLTWALPFGIAWFVTVTVIFRQTDNTTVAAWALGAVLLIFVILSDGVANWWCRAINGLLK